MRLPEKCAEALGDYAFELESGRRIPAPPKDRKLRAVTHKPLPFGQAAERAAEAWEHAQEKGWRARGQLDAAGRLLAVDAPLPPYTLKAVRALWPGLALGEYVALMVDLDGIAEEGFMDKHESIRKVVAAIVGEEMDRYLSGADGQDRVKEIAEQAVADVFEVVGRKLAHRPTANSRTGKKNKCGKCGVPGHRAPTCPATNP